MPMAPRRSSAATASAHPRDVTGPFEHSKSRIDRAGAELREWLTADADQDSPEDALAVIESFRRAHRDAMMEVADQPASLAGRNDDQASVTFRLKRSRQIAVKLLFKPSMRLSQLNDIAGCRVVAPLETLTRVQHGIEQAMDVVDVDDYRDQPQPTGYRAVHVIVRVRGMRVEVQLRTPLENAWAGWIEDLARRPALRHLKQGVMSDRIREGFVKVSDLLASGTVSLAGFEQFREELDRLIDVT